MRFSIRHSIPILHDYLYPSTADHSDEYGYSGLHSVWPLSLVNSNILPAVVWLNIGSRTKISHATLRFARHSWMYSVQSNIALTHVVAGKIFC